MDELLKARKLSSASARRRRIEEQREAEILAKERYIEHKRRILLYDNLAEEGGYDSEIDSEADSTVSPSQHERDDLVQTPSEYSVTTPHDTPPAQTMFDDLDGNSGQGDMMVEKPELHILVPDTPSASDEPSTIIPPSPQPKMLASLAAPSDWQYQRFSMVFTQPPDHTSPPQDVESVPDLEDDAEEESPLETAKRISYLPRTRPSVISISSKSSSRKRPALSMQSLPSQTSRSASPVPPPPPRSEKRLSIMSTRSGFQASEASPVQIPDLPDNAMYMISNASQHSFAPQPTEIGISRKSSTPLLSAIKTSHARMSSIKNLIKPPTHARLPSVKSASRPGSRSSISKAPASAADILDDSCNPFETVPANLHEPLPRSSVFSRPKSSHRPTASRVSTVSQYSVTALPRPPLEDMRREPSAQGRQQEEAGAMRRKKSFSSLRKRSESIGQAIKFATTKSKPISRSDESPPPPPVPVILAPRPPSSHRMQGVVMPVPAVPSPRNRKSVASYSPFPPSPRVGAPIGLGLKV